MKPVELKRKLRIEFVPVIKQIEYYSYDNISNVNFVFKFENYMESAMNVNILQTTIKDIIRSI